MSIARALFALYGVLNRDNGCAWPSQQQSVVTPLIQAGYAVDIYTLDIIGLQTIDGVPSQLPTSGRGAKFAERISVDVIDRENVAFCKTVRCAFRPSYDEYPGLVTRALRQLWLEQHVSKFIRSTNNTYQVVVAMENSIYLKHPIAASDFTAAQKRAIMLRSGNNDAGGYTNGLYVGSPDILVRVMNRRIAPLFPEPNDYEAQLKRACKRLGIHSRILKGHGAHLGSLSKLRHNGRVWGPSVDSTVTACLTKHL